MPQTIIDRKEVYNQQTGEVHVEEYEITVPTPEEELAAKQEELLRVYQEIQQIQANITQ